MNSTTHPGDRDATPEQLRTRAAVHRDWSAELRRNAAYADSAQARGFDELAAREHDAKAQELEARAAALETPNAHS
ncbi:hypothetical protein [uncultured Thiodictyon sp.]|uniref:hypothetical protein n=1 Tax=uncultured Thiodictyon sp. TaxID=1846217 RepID=UPI0025D324FE|nr:hypothetical protein [uncultured Thiodictyon sp.]